MIQTMPTNFFEIAQALARRKQIEDERKMGSAQAGGRIIGAAGNALMGGPAGGGLAAGISAIQEREKRKAALDEVRRALDPNHSVEGQMPQTEAGIKALEQRRARDAEAAQYADKVRIGETDRKQRRTEYEDRLAMDLERMNRDREATGREQAGDAEIAALAEWAGNPDIGFEFPTGGGPTGQDPQSYTTRTPRPPITTREGAEFMTGLNRERRIEETAREREARLSSPRPESPLDAARRLKIEAETAKIKSDADAAIRGRGEMTDNAALNAAIRALESNTVFNENTWEMETVPYKTEDVLREYAKFKGKPAGSTGTSDPALDAMVEEIMARTGQSREEVMRELEGE